MKTTVTIHELVSAVSEFAENENEVIATVLHMIESGQVHLTTGLGSPRTRFRDDAGPDPSAVQLTGRFGRKLR